MSPIVVLSALCFVLSAMTVIASVLYMMLFYTSMLRIMRLVFTVFYFVNIVLHVWPGRIDYILWP